MTARHGDLWIGLDTQLIKANGTLSGGTLQDLNPATGAVREQIAIGGDASVVRTAAGDLWFVDPTNGILIRLRPTQP